MSLSIRSTLTSWTTLVPVMAMVALATASGREVAGVLVVLVVLLAGTVLAAVHHAEVVAFLSFSP
jgi:Ca2+:H+ antiporter